MDVCRNRTSGGCRRPIHDRTGHPGGDAADDGADRSIEGATRFRQEEFLRSDPVWVQRAVSDRAAFPDVSWGTPLTEDEAAEMNARVRFQKGPTTPSLLPPARTATARHV